MAQSERVVVSAFFRSCQVMVAQIEANPKDEASFPPVACYPCLKGISAPQEEFVLKENGKSWCKQNFETGGKHTHTHTPEAQMGPLSRMYG